MTRPSWVEDTPLGPKERAQLAEGLRYNQELLPVIVRTLAGEPGQKSPIGCLVCGTPVPLAELKRADPWKPIWAYWWRCPDCTRLRLTTIPPTTPPRGSLRAPPGPSPP